MWGAALWVRGRAGRGDAERSRPSGPPGKTGLTLGGNAHSQPHTTLPTTTIAHTGLRSDFPAGMKDKKHESAKGSGSDPPCPPSGLGCPESCSWTPTNSAVPFAPRAELVSSDTPCHGDLGQPGHLSGGSQPRRPGKVQTVPSTRPLQHLGCWAKAPSTGSLFKKHREMKVSAQEQFKERCGG